MSASLPALPDHYADYQGPERRVLLELRELILRTAAQTEGVGEIEETLKWGQPSFVTRRPKSGSTIRIDAIADTGKVAAFFICTTNLVETFRQLYPDDFAFEGNRAMVFDAGARLPREALGHCSAIALTYHLRNGHQNKGGPEPASLRS